MKETIMPKDNDEISFVDRITNSNTSQKTDEVSKDKTEVILIVEDSKMYQKKFSDTLTDSFPDYKVVAVDSLEGALDIFNDENNKISYLLTDNSFFRYVPGPEVRDNLIVDDLGVNLIKMVRNGELGEDNKKIPIGFQSGGMNEEIEKQVHDLEGLTFCYIKNGLPLAELVATDLKDILKGTLTESISYTITDREFKSPPVSESHVERLAKENPDKEPISSGFVNFITNATKSFTRKK
jgi:WD40 repeat protein